MDAHLNLDAARVAFTSDATWQDFRANMLARVRATDAEMVAAEDWR